MLRFIHAQRLTQKSQFDVVYKEGRRFSNSCFTVLVRPNQVGQARLGLSIAVRSAGNAVNRNRIKRAIRESFRLHQQGMPALDLVIGTRSGARDAPNQVLAEKLARCWHEVKAQCAPHSSC